MGIDLVALTAFAEGAAGSRAAGCGLA